MIRRLAILTGPLLAILVAWLAPGCADLNSMPTQPAIPDGDDWTELYAPVALNSLSAAWAMDADDAWFVGSYGAVLHYDGERVVRHEFPTSQWFKDVDGCATDEVWAVTSSVVIRWDGRQWSEVPFGHSTGLRTVLCEAPDQVYIGGTDWRYPVGNFPLVHRYTGQGWKSWGLPTAEGQVRKLWRPHVDGPLFAIVQDSVRHTYRIDDGRWDLLDWPGETIDADGDLVLMESDDDENPARLCRLEPDHSLTVVCENFAGRRIVQSRAPVAGFTYGLQFEVECSRRTVLDGTSHSIRDIAVPRRPGPEGIAMFVVGNGAMAMVGGWNRDWTMDWKRISPIESYDLHRPMLGDETHVFVPYSSEESRGILIQSPTGWHIEPLGYVPDGLRFLANGDLMVWHRSWGNESRGEVHCRDANGNWRALPATGHYTRGVWGTRDDDLMAMGTDGRFLRLDGDTWVPLDDLGGYCDWFDGLAADRLYATIRPEGVPSRRLLEYDGVIWRDITPENATSVDNCYLAPFSGTLYAGCSSIDGYLPMKRRDGRWEEYLEGHERGVNDDRMQEAADGGLYYRQSRSIHRWHPGGWKPTYVHEDYFDAFVIDPDRGVHVQIDDHLLHHPYRPR